MTPIALLDFAAVFFAGMLAGIEFGIHFGVRAPIEQLPDPAQLQLRKAMTLKLRVIVPAFFAPTALLTIALSVLRVGAPGFAFRCAAVVALLVWVGIRVVGTIPINSATLDWPLDAPPADWKAQVMRAERFHTLGVWAAVSLFAFLLIALALKLTVR